MHLNQHKSQVSLELVVAVAGVFLLIYAAFNLMVWLNSSLVRRNTEYEKTRTEASKSASSVIVDETNQTKFPKLNILGEKN